jgi:hypothetical protein
MVSQTLALLATTGQGRLRHEQQQTRITNTGGSDQAYPPVNWIGGNRYLARFDLCGRTTLNAYIMDASAADL